MTTALILVFVLAYAAIAFEHPLKINKSASARAPPGVIPPPPPRAPIVSDSTQQFARAIPQDHEDSDHFHSN